MADSKEALALYVLDSSGKPSTNHDDKLTLRFNRGDYPTGAVKDGKPVVNKGIGLSPSWKESPYTEYEYKDGQRILDGYFNGLPAPYTAFMDAEKYRALPPAMQSQWIPYYRKCIPLAEGVKLAFVKSTVELRMYDLFDKMLDSRYGRALEHMAELVNMGIFTYKPSTDEPTEKNIYNAIRMRILRAKQMFEYEHDTLLAGSIGRPIYEYLREHPTGKMRLENNTIYVQGYGKEGKPAKAIKLYDAPARDDMEPGRMYKIETTLYTPYFTKHGITVDSLTKQPRIMELIKDELEDSLLTVLNALSREVLAVTAEAYAIDSRDVKLMPRQIARSMLNNTLTQDVADLKRRMATAERDIAALKRATGIR